jgi:hypothetical protein
MANHMRDPASIKENKTDRIPAMAEAEMNNVIHFNPTLLKDFGYWRRIIQCMIRSHTCNKKYVEKSRNMI